MSNIDQAVVDEAGKAVEAGMPRDKVAGILADRHGITHKEAEEAIDQAITAARDTRARDAMRAELDAISERGRNIKLKVSDGDLWPAVKFLIVDQGHTPAAVRAYLTGKRDTLTKVDAGEWGRLDELIERAQGMTNTSDTGPKAKEARFPLPVNPNPDNGQVPRVSAQSPEAKKYDLLPDDYGEVPIIDGDHLTLRNIRVPLNVREDGDELYQTVRDLVSRTLWARTPELLDAALMWSLSTWVFREVGYASRLLVVSPAEGSGKSRWKQVLKLFALNPVDGDAITSEAPLAAAIDQHGGCTIFMDEANNTLAREDNGRLVNVLNNGIEDSHRQRMAKTDESGDYTRQPQSLFSPLMLLGNGMLRMLPRDTQSRCLMIPVNRAPRDVELGELTPREEARLARAAARVVRFLYWERHRAGAVGDPVWDDEEGGYLPPEADPYHLPPGLVHRERDRHKASAAVAALLGPKTSALYYRTVEALVPREKALHSNRGGSKGIELARHAAEWMGSLHGGEWKTAEQICDAVREANPRLFGSLLGEHRALTPQRVAETMFELDVIPDPDRGYSLTDIRERLAAYLPDDEEEEEELPF